MTLRRFQEQGNSSKQQTKCLSKNHCSDSGTQKCDEDKEEETRCSGPWKNLKYELKPMESEERNNKGGRQWQLLPETGFIVQQEWFKSADGSG